MHGRQGAREMDRRHGASLTEVIAFPLSATARARWLVIAALLLLIEFMTRECIRLVTSADGRLTVLGAMATVLTVLVAAGGFAFTAACAMAVVRDTANGCDAIANWPGVAFMEWAGDALFVVNGICISVAAGMGLGWALQQGGVRIDGAVVGGCLATFVLFPIVMLSLLENESAFDVVSPPVWRTFALAPGGWIRFYLVAGVVAALAGLLVAVAWSSPSPWLLVAVNLAWSGLGLVLCRLMGRLALCCAQRAAAAARHAEAAIEIDDSSDDDESG